MTCCGMSDMHRRDLSVLRLCYNGVSMDTIETTGLLLDIDNTLAATSRFFFCSLAERFGLPEGESVESLHERYHYSWRVPHWQHDEARAWDNAQEHSVEFHEQMTPIAEAQRGVLEVQEFVPITAYVTTRPELLREVTRSWLLRHGFPDAPLVMRPNEMSPKSGNQWKVHQVHSFFATSFGIVDDHVDVARGLAGEYAGSIFHYNGNPLVEVPARVTSCSSWQSIVTAVERVCVSVV